MSWFSWFLQLSSVVPIAHSTATAADDLVSKIPYFDGSVNFDVYAGYLSAQTAQFFYFFTESANDPSTDPLVLWLNGGPGCSSLLGAFTELGPFHPYNWGTNLEYNPYSWNNIANILFLESPACNGFSFPNDRQSCDTFFTGDNQTAIDNYAALQSFFTKFPDYIDRPFFIAGESYAGHYIPQLASLIIDENNAIGNATQSVDDNVYINLEGIAVGNPYTQRDSNWFDGWLPTMYNLGIINPTQYDALHSGNCSNLTLDGDCETTAWRFIDDFLWNEINVYDVNVLYNCSERSHQQIKLLRYITQSNKFESNLEEMTADAYPYSPCDENNLYWYLNDEKVQSAFHVDTQWIASDNFEWDVCAFNWDGYDINNTDDAMDQVIHYPKIMNSSVRVLIYSGNDDLVCAYTGSRKWIYRDLANDTSKGEQLTEWQSWKVNGEVGGWYQEWENLVFLVVRDAGHEVPQFQPQRAYVMFRRFLANNYDNTHETLSNEDNWPNYGSDASGSDGSDFWKGVGSALGVVIAIALLFCVLYFLFWRRRRTTARHSIGLVAEVNRVDTDVDAI